MTLLRSVYLARWLTTSQIHRGYFSGATPDAARKRLRLLAHAGYIVKFQRTRMEESLFRLGPQGKRLLEKSGLDSITLQSRPPKQLEHLAGVNDMRIAAEGNPELSYFFAYWQLPSLKWRHPVIPDAVFAVGGNTFALEFDRGEEGLRYFIRTKVGRYTRGFIGFRIDTVVIVADTAARMESLKNGIGKQSMRMLFATQDQIRRQGMWAKVFHEFGRNQLVGLSESLSSDTPKEEKGLVG